MRIGRNRRTLVLVSVILLINIENRTTLLCLHDLQAAFGRLL
jgi:hypothetical protein